MKRKFSIPIVLLFASFAVLPAQKPKNMKPGVERWPIKTSVHKLHATAKEVSFGELIALPNPPGVKKNDSRYQDAFIPSFQNSQNLEEGDIVHVSGWLHLVADQTDGDFHIQISNSATSGDSCLIIEVPYPTYIKSSPNLKTLFTSVRSFVKSILPGKKDPGTSGTILKSAVYVSVTGQLFYDDSHVGDPPRGKRGMHAATLWEVHPVTGLEGASPPGH